MNQLKGLTFRNPRFSDLIYEFVVQDGQVKGLKQHQLKRNMILYICRQVTCYAHKLPIKLC